MNNPYQSANPGDPILAESWNQMQRDVRHHVTSHTHTGAPDAGALLTGASIDKGSTIEVQKVVASTLSVKGIDVGPKLEALSADKLSVTGGSVTGTLSAGTLKVTGDTTLGGNMTLSDKSIYLRGDTNHGLGYAGGGVKFAQQAPDGPALYGFGGGLLGTTSGGQKVALSWDSSSNVAVTNRLSVSGVLSVGTGYAATQNYMAKGSLTIGDTGNTFGGGTSQWNKNTACLMLETSRNTEIAVHDSQQRLASLMYYEGKGDNRVTIGRNMGWDTLASVNIATQLNVAGSLKIGSNFALSSPEQAIRVVWGFVNMSAGVVSGKGFTVKIEGDGFRVTFSTAFAERPCVLAVQHYNSGDIRDNAVVFEINQGNCLIKTGDGGGKTALRHFCFIAIGP